MSVTPIASAATATSFIASEPSRKGSVVTNDDANRLYVLMGSGTVSATNYSFSLAQYENAYLRGYSGALSGIWASDGSGYAYVTVW